MENLWLFLATVAVFGFLLWSVEHVNTLNLFKWTTKELAARIALLTVLCAPFNIDGNVFTVIGNATSSKNVYSIASFYQNAGRDAVNFIGFSGYQNAGRDAVNFIGFSGYQNAGRNAGILLGFSGYQNAGLNADILLGFSGYQNAGRRTLVHGVALFQRVTGKERTFGIGSLNIE